MILFDTLLALYLSRRCQGLPGAARAMRHHETTLLCVTDNLVRAMAFDRDRSSGCALRTLIAGNAAYQVG